MHFLQLIVKKLDSCKSGKYSNSGIESIYKECCKQKQFATDQILDIIDTYEPNITPDELKRYNEEYSKFSRKNFND